MGFARDLFIVATVRDLSTRAKEVVPSIDEGKFIFELVDMQSSITMPQQLRTNGPAKFWSDVNGHQFLTSRKLQSVFSACVDQHKLVNQAFRA